MKNLKLIDKVLYCVNGLLAFILLLSYVLPFVPPKTFPLLSVLSLGVPFLILINVLFFLYWLIKLKKQLILSLVVLIIGYFSFGSLYKFSSADDVSHDNALKVMNFNVRLFNLYEWIPEKHVETKIVDFIKQHYSSFERIEKNASRHTIVDELRRVGDVCELRQSR